MTDILEPTVLDAIPDLAPAPLSCRTCGAELAYSGRGRKPVYCDEHKKTKGTPSKSSGAKGVNDKLAREATDSLIQLNRVLGFTIYLAGMPETSRELSDSEDSFRASCERALLTDPGLARQILAAGAMSGKVALALAYAQLGMRVGPVGIMEIRAKRAAKETNAGEV